MDEFRRCFERSPVCSIRIRPDRNVRFKLILAVSIFSLLAPGACSRTPLQPLEPTPSPSPAPSPTPTPYPPGAPDATAFANIAHVTNLERASGRATVLVAIGGALSLDGTVSPGSAWTYSFADPQSAAPVRLAQWAVFSDGHVVASMGFRWPAATSTAA